MIQAATSSSPCLARSCSGSSADSASRSESRRAPRSFLPLAPVLLHVEHRARLVAFGQQPQPPRHLLIGLDLAAHVAAEAVLVELVAGFHVPQAAAVGA